MNNATDNCGGALAAFAKLCQQAAPMLRKLASQPALTPESGARIELASSLLPALAEEAMGESGYLERLAAEDTKLAYLRDDLEQLAGQLRLLAKHSSSAAKTLPGARRGAPRKDAKLNATIELANIFERYGGLRPGRTSKQFRRFVAGAFRLVGEARGATAHVQAALRLRREATRDD